MTSSVECCPIIWIVYNTFVCLPIKQLAHEAQVIARSGPVQGSPSFNILSVYLRPRAEQVSGGAQLSSAQWGPRRALSIFFYFTSKVAFTDVKVAGKVPDNEFRKKKF